MQRAIRSQSSSLIKEDVGHEGSAVGKDANAKSNLVQIIFDHLPKDVGHEGRAVS